MTDYVKTLQNAREQMVKARREVAEELARPYSDTPRSRTIFIEIQTVIEQKLAPGESAHKIASRLTLKIFYARRDDTGDFDRSTESLRYAQSGCFEAIRGSPAILWRFFAITVVG